MRDNDSNTIFAGGIVAVLVMIGLSLKALKRIFIELEHTFYAFGKMAHSFWSMAWNSVVALGLVAVGIGCVFAAIYFTYKYYLMVKRGTELKKAVDIKICDFSIQLHSNLEEIRETYDERIHYLELKLHQALDRQLSSLDTQTSEIAHSEAQGEDSSPKDVSNPF